MENSQICESKQRPERRCAMFGAGAFILFLLIVTRLFDPRRDRRMIAKDQLNH
jgi:hypothetical protein